MTERWSHQFWLRMAKHYAEEGSKDPSTKVGCVIVRPDRTPASWGVNGFPMGIADTEARLNDRPTKYELTVHAELNSILFATESVKGMTLYSTFAPCIRCAATIVQAGLGRVVFYYSDVERWAAEQKRSTSLFEEGGVEVIAIDPLSGSEMMRLIDGTFSTYADFIG